MSYVLIVEPDEFMRKNLTDLLETGEKNFEYDIVSTADRAVDLLERKKIDVLVSEIEMPVISGRELFSMAQMLSEDTVRIAMTDAKRIQDTINFMNECKTFKIIITPCRVLDDIMEPVKAAITYKNLLDQTKKEEEQAELNLFSTEADYHRMEKSFRENSILYQQMSDLVVKMMNRNFTASDLSKEEILQVQFFLQWMFKAYLSAMVNCNGNYTICCNNLLNEFHREETGHIFKVKKKTEGEIQPKQMNQITFMAMMMTQVCKQFLMKYKVTVGIEESEKYYIVRYVCNYSDSVDPTGTIIYKERNEKIREEITKVTQKFMDLYSFKSVSLTKENEYILNFAVLK